MKVHFFTAQIVNSGMSVNSLLSEIFSESQLDREIPVVNGVLFLEDLQENQGYFHVEFTKRRTRHGPGHSVQGTRTTDFRLQQGGGFGEQTALVWSKDRNVVALQYNHYGPRVGAISKYLSPFLIPSNQNKPLIVFRPVIDLSALDRLQQSAYQLSLEVAVDRAALREEFARQNRTIAAIAALGSEVNGDTIDFTIRVNKRRRLRDIRDTAMALRNICRKLRVVVGTPDDEVELLDLLEQREFVEIEEHRLVQTSGLRWDFDSRRVAMEEELKLFLDRNPGV